MTVKEAPLAEKEDFACFHVCANAENDPFIQEQLAENRRLFTSWLQAIEECERQGMDVAKICAHLALRLGLSKTGVNPIVRALLIVRKMPKTLRLARKYGHIDRTRLSSIGSRLRGLDPKHYRIVDAFIARQISPKTHKEQLVHGVTLSRYLAKYRVEIEKTPPPPLKKGRGRARVTEHGNYLFSALFPPSEGEQIYQVIHKKQLRDGIDFAEALRRIVCGDAAPQAIVHVLVDDHGQPYLEGAGWISPEEAAKLDLRGVRYMYDGAVAKQYQVPDYLRYYVKARDGICRYPECTVAAAVCQPDHVISFRNGGQTSADNLQCLCQHHHNLKTIGFVKVSMDKHGVCTWTLNDGKVVTTLPQGPLRHHRLGEDGKPVPNPNAPQN